MFVLGFFFPILGGTTALTIDCGSSTDAYYVGGLPWVIPQGILPPGTTDATIRYGASFVYPIPAGSTGTPYLVTLHFIEPTVASVGQRVFSVYANDQPIIDRLDLVAAVGYLKPMARAFVVASSDGYIKLRFTGQVRTALVASIEIAPLPTGGGSSFPVTIPAQKAGEGMLLIDVPGSTPTTTYSVNPAVVGFLGASNSWTNRNDFGAAAHTTPSKIGKLADAPQGCSIGEQYFATDAKPGFNLYGCTSPGIWTAQR
jgi:hypothetical protein